MKKYIQYLLIRRKLNRAIKKENEVQSFCVDLGVGFDDVTLRNLQDKLRKVNRLWLTKNMIN